MNVQAISVTPMSVRVATRYPNLAVASMTLTCLRIFMTPSSSRNNEDRTVRIRPVQIIFLELDSVCIGLTNNLLRVGATVVNLTFFPKPCSVTTPYSKDPYVRCQGEIS